MGEDEINESKGVLVVRWAGLPVAGALVVLLLKLLVSWLLTLPWAPYRGLLKLVDSIPEPWATLGALAVGAAGGLVLSVMAHGERLAVAVSAERVVLEGDGYAGSFDRDDVAAVFVDKKHLVLLGHDTGELVRRPSELDVAGLKTVFTRHDYPWRDGDPHAGEYRRWVPDMEGLPPGANALLAVRAKKLGSLDDTEAKELRAELVKLGVVVRDSKSKQYWRLVR
ncbi:YqeB family protein [Actinophytocola sp.]|uniref:YqeB family protein n=1 Tax=Actinophytocola sp. TaxID=1872138 RepID=UPI002ED323DA